MVASITGCMMGAQDMGVLDMCVLNVEVQSTNDPFN